jgi:small subunit ribosomal protein S6
LRQYEMLTIFAPQLGEEDLTNTIEQVTGYVTGNGGTISETVKDSPWGRRRLAYPIRYNSQDVRDGFYVLYHFDAEPPSIDPLDRAVRLNDRILRHLIVKVGGEE